MGVSALKTYSMKRNIVAVDWHFIHTPLKFTEPIRLIHDQDLHRPSHQSSIPFVMPVGEQRVHYYR